MEEKKNQAVEPEVETEVTESTTVDAEVQTETAANVGEDQAVEKSAEQEQVESLDEVSDEKVPVEADAEEKTESLDVKQKKEKKEKAPKQKKLKEKKVKEKKEKHKKVKAENEEIVVDESELSDDELYAKIQTEKLLNRKKVKKISTLIGVCFAFVLVAAIIVLAAVPFSLLPKCVDDNYHSVQLVKGSTSSGNKAFTKGSDGYDKFQTLLEESFSQPYLSAIFSGSMFDYQIEEKYGQKQYDAVFGSTGTLASSETWYVRLQYENEHTLTKQNGKKFVSGYSNSEWDGVFTFTNVYIVVNSEEGFKDTKIYVPITYPEDFDDETGEVTSTVKGVAIITVRANTNEIYEKWDELLAY